MLARVRAEGRAAELTAADLRLSDREALGVLASAGAQLPPREAKELNARAEGWPAGVYLTGLSLAARIGMAPREAAPGEGAHHFVADYFEAEVLSRLEPATAAFARRVAVLDRLSGPVCDAVAGAPGSAARLSELAAAGAFLVPLDREHLTFRFHRYFRDALLARFRHEEHAEFVACSRRAAGWYEAAGDRAAAMAYLQQIGDHAGAVRLLGLLGPDVLCRGLLGLSRTVSARSARSSCRRCAAAVTGALRTPSSAIPMRSSAGSQRPRRRLRPAPGSSSCARRSAATASSAWATTPGPPPGRSRGTRRSMRALVSCSGSPSS